MRGIRVVACTCGQSCWSTSALAGTMQFRDAQAAADLDASWQDLSMFVKVGLGSTLCLVAQVLCRLSCSVCQPAQLADACSREAISEQLLSKVVIAHTRLVIV